MCVKYMLLFVFKNLISIFFLSGITKNCKFVDKINIVLFKHRKNQHRKNDILLSFTTGNLKIYLKTIREFLILWI